MPRGSFSGIGLEPRTLAVHLPMPLFCLPLPPQCRKTEDRFMLQPLSFRRTVERLDTPPHFCSWRTSLSHIEYKGPPRRYLCMPRVLEKDDVQYSASTVLCYVVKASVAFAVLQLLSKLDVRANEPQEEATCPRSSAGLQHRTS